MTAAAVLPQPVAEEILRRYADVLRVGSLAVNGEIVKWHTDTSTQEQLRHFCAALFGRLRQLPELAKASDEVLRQASYWVCKAVSINYALIEVLLLVKRKVGVMCTIETRDDFGGLVSYSLEARHTQVMRVRLSWRGKNNIVYRDPLTAAKKVKGTLSSLETEFCLPPAPRFAPCYRLQVKFEKSMAAKLVSTVTCGDVRASGRVPPTETILIQDPLHSEYPVEVLGAQRADTQVFEASPSASEGMEVFDVAALEALDIDDYCEDLRRRSVEGSPATVTTSSASMSSRQYSGYLPPCSPHSTPLTAEPRCFTARSVRLPLPTPSAGSTAGAGARPVGCLRVRVLRAKDLARRRRLFGDSPGGAVESYCRCSVAGRTEQTVSARASSSGHEWHEVWDFPVQEKDLHGEVLIEVLDSAGGEVGTEQALLGRARVPVSTVLSNGGKASMTESLEGPARGCVQLELELLTDVPEWEDPAAWGDDDSSPQVGAIPPSCSMSPRSWAV